MPGGGRALGLRHGRHPRGLGPGGVRGERARLWRARHPRLQRRHRPFGASGPARARRLGALVRGERDRPLPGRPRGHAHAPGAGPRRRLSSSWPPRTSCRPARTSRPTRRPRRRRRNSRRCWRWRAAPHGIRSNIVNPDAVFQDSGLWSSDIRRERAAAQGIAVDAARGLLPQAQPARARGSCPRTSPRPCCSSPPTARPRRRAARSPWTAASRTPSRASGGLLRPCRSSRATPAPR